MAARMGQERPDMGNLKRICVYLGSNPGHNPAYGKTAIALANALACRNITLVYGGAHVGTMGVLADAALAAGGQVIGVIPRALVGKEIAHEGLSELHIVDTMHARKRLMADLADGFIALPGGAGTLEELAEVWTWGQLGMHTKPIALLNVDGYYRLLGAFLDHVTAQGFMARAHRDMLIIDDDIDQLLARLAAYQAPQISKWIDAKDI